MKFRTRHRWRIVRDHSIGWVLALIFLAIVRGVGATEDGHIDFELSTSVVYASVFGVLFGSISGLAQVWTEERISGRISIQKLLALRVIYAALFLITMVVTSYLIVGKWYLGLDISLIEFAFDDGSFAIYLYLLVVEFSMAFLSQVSLMLGRGQLSNLLRGKFYTPREEDRIFMFLDLQSSTHLAETLGHITYSRMIQDCFNDLGVVVEDEAEIYQYVGDEVVLTWRLGAGLRNTNCLNAYFRFAGQLEKRTDYYLETYGCLPFFKAGVNAGRVTVTEVGKYKKEIAYHGDAINTAARIQGLCNDYNKGLLVSENVVDALGSHSVTFNELGSIQLRGKEEKVSIYAVSRAH